MAYTKKQLEELTEKCIVVTPKSFYKLTSLKREGNGSYTTEFTELENNKEAGKERFPVSCTFDIDFFEGKLCFLDTLHCDSYYEEDGPCSAFYLKAEPTNRKSDISSYIEEFFINYAKLQQNMLNQLRQEKKRYETSFKILSSLLSCIILPLIILL